MYNTNDSLGFTIFRFGIIILLLIITLDISLIAQDKKLEKTVSLGISIPVGTELSDVYGVGGRLKASIKKPIKERLMLGPAITLGYFGNNVNNDVRDNLRMIEFGFETVYNLTKTKKDRIEALANVNYSLNRNFLSTRNGDRVTRNILTANGFGFDVGIRYRLTKTLHLEGLFIYRNPEAKLDQNIISDISASLPFSPAQSIVVFSDYRISLSQISLSLGYKF